MFLTLTFRNPIIVHIIADSIGVLNALIPFVEAFPSIITPKLDYNKYKQIFISILLILILKEIVDNSNDYLP